MTRNLNLPDVDDNEETDQILALLEQLLSTESRKFSTVKQLEAPSDQGVYIIYDSAGRILHVGQTTRGRRGLKQRLTNHLHGESSFVRAYFKGDGEQLMMGHCTFRCLPVADPRRRCLLEAVSIGLLCPLHIGLHQPKKP